MPYFSESYFRNYSSNLTEARRRVYSDHSSERSSSYDFDVFLSYNFEDRLLVKGVYHWLREAGLKVYLDFEVDPQLDRKNVTKETAELIHSRLKHSKSLIYAQSPNANMSKWMPWELGVVDGHTGRCAILPITPNGVVPAPRQEYLQLYPLIRLNVDNNARVYTDKFPYSGISINSFINEML